MKTIIGSFIAGVLMLAGCSKANNDVNGGGGSGGGGSTAVEITGTPTNYPFWGDTITITGKGFGSNPADVSVKYIANSTGTFTSASGNIKIISVAPTTLKVTAPLTLTPAGNATGPDYAKLIVTVKGQSDTSDNNIKFVGFPFLNPFCYFYGAAQATARAGDSTILSMGMYGLYAQESGYMDKVKLEGENIIRRSAGTCSGFAMLMSTSKYASTANCVNDPQLGEPASDFNFRVYIEGTNKSVSKTLKVLTLPTISVSQVTGPVQISKSAPGNPTWTITGRNLNFYQIKYTGNGVSTSSSVTNCNWCNQTSFQIQLADLPAGPLPGGASYTVIAVGPCAKEYPLGSVTIIP